MSEPGAARIGVLLVNLGTPAAPTAAAIRRYLREFLGDRRVVELPRALWWPVLYGVILPLRPRKLVGAYAKVWRPQGSPLLAESLAQQQALQRALGDGFAVVLAMRYGEPSIEQALRQLETQQLERVLVLPLYPQYSSTTTASVLDALFDCLRRRRVWPELRTIADYHDDPGYLDALADSVRTHWQAEGRGDHLLLSFHSIPQRGVDLGDPYARHCERTARLLAQRLHLRDDEWSLSYQSRIGRAQWLRPYTDVLLPQLAARGVRRLDVACPGFAADCLETLEEVALRYAESFAAAGGSLRYIAALNDRPAHITALAALVRRHAGGWIVPASG